MSRIFTTLFLMSFAIVRAQTPLTLVSADMPVPPFNNRVFTDNALPAGFNIGQSGANRVWNYATLQPRTSDTVLVQTLSAAQQTAFPSGDARTTLDNINYLVSNTTPTVLEYVGVDGNLQGITATVPFSPTSKQLQFPCTYNVNFSGTTGLQVEFPGSQVGQPVDRVRVTITTNYSDTIDGWGKLVTPTGAYKALRKVRKETTTTRVEIKLLSFSPWSNAPGYPQTATTTAHSWLARETKGPVLTLGYDSLRNINSATYSTIPPAVPTPNFGWASGGGGLIIFTDSTDGYPDRYSWNFGDGDTSNQRNPNHVYAANGTYNVCLTVFNVSGSAQICKQVTVSGIVPANSPPVAFDDTASVTQPNTVSIAVLANDVDPDANPLTLSAVTNGANGSATISGSNIVYDPNNAFTGVDSFQYTVCDNGSPQGCDTAWVRVTVYPEPIQPVADFSFTQSDCNGGEFINTSADAASVSWSFVDLNGTEPDATFTTDTVAYDAVQNRELEVCITATNAFGTDTYCDTVVLLCSGIQIQDASNLRIFPNPASDLLFVQADAVTGSSTSFRIFDLNGRSVLEGDLNQSRSTVSVAGLSPGMYMFKINSSENTSAGIRFCIRR